MQHLYDVQRWSLVRSSLFRVTFGARHVAVPADYYSPLDEHGFRLDLKKHPELMYGSIDIVAPSEYVVRPPQVWRVSNRPAQHIFHALCAAANVHLRN